MPFPKQCTTHIKRNRGHPKPQGQVTCFIKAPDQHMLFFTENPQNYGERYRALVARAASLRVLYNTGRRSIHKHYTELVCHSQAILFRKRICVSTQHSDKIKFRGTDLLVGLLHFCFYFFSIIALNFKESNMTTTAPLLRKLTAMLSTPTLTLEVWTSKLLKICYNQVQLDRYLHNIMYMFVCSGKEIIADKLLVKR